MPENLKRLAGPTQLGTSAATVYTSPNVSGQVVSIITIRVVNTGSADALFYMSIGTDAASKRIAHAVAVPAAGGMYTDPDLHVLGQNEVVQAYSDTATTLTLTMSGVVEP